MASKYVVVGELVQFPYTDDNGETVQVGYLYKGTPVPENAPDEWVLHHLDVALIAEQSKDDPSLPKNDPAEKPEPKKAPAR